MSPPPGFSDTPPSHPHSRLGHIHTQFTVSQDWLPRSRGFFLLNCKARTQKWRGQTDTSRKRFGRYTDTEAEATLVLPRHIKMVPFYYCREAGNGQGGQGDQVFKSKVYSRMTDSRGRQGGLHSMKSDTSCKSVRIVFMGHISGSSLVPLGRE